MTEPTPDLTPDPTLEPASAETDAPASRGPLPLVRRYGPTLAMVLALPLFLAGLHLYQGQKAKSAEQKAATRLRADYALVAAAKRPDAVGIAEAISSSDNLSSIGNAENALQVDDLVFVDYHATPAKVTLYLKPAASSRVIVLRGGRGGASVSGFGDYSLRGLYALLAYGSLALLVPTLIALAVATLARRPESPLAPVAGPRQAA